MADYRDIDGTASADHRTDPARTRWRFWRSHQDPHHKAHPGTIGLEERVAFDQPGVESMR
jgi:hypothetical protein